MPNFLVNNNFYQGTSDACIVDLNPPVFAGINFLDVQSRGQIRAGWLAATDPTAPIRYEVYIKASTATGLFSTTNIIALTPNLQYDIFNLPDGSFLQNGTTYYVGVRAIDGVNNRDNNLVSMSVISTGILTSIDVYEAKASFCYNALNEFGITMWADKNGSLAKAPDAVLGTASYQVYDGSGVAISGMSGSGITANAEGLFVAPHIPNLVNFEAGHYEIKVTVSVDGEDRTNFLDRYAEVPNYDINGTGSVDPSGMLVGSFWVTKNERIVTTNLGVGSYQVYTGDGVAVPGFSETGIVPNSDGFFIVTPTPLPPIAGTPGASFIARYTIEVEGTVRSTQVIFAPGTTTYTCRAAFSINALNQLEATFWSTINDELTSPTLVGTASYAIYDKNGVAVSGLTESGIVADAAGFFHITPVNAVLITDLSHYIAKITINVSGIPRVAAKGFTLLGN